MYMFIMDGAVRYLHSGKQSGSIEGFTINVIQINGTTNICPSKLTIKHKIQFF